VQGALWLWEGERGRVLLKLKKRLKELGLFYLYSRSPLREEREMLVTSD
jgi:hypothetical protein